MTSLICAGIDAGQRSLDIGLAPSGRTFRLPNTAAALGPLLERLQRDGVQRVVLEAAGTYAQPVAHALDAAGFAVGVVNPRRIKAFREAEGKRAKTDRLDAGLIARFALVMTDAIRPLPSAEQRTLKALATRRRQLTEMIAMEKTRLKQALEPAVAESHRAAIADLSRACAKVEALIEDGLAKDPRRAEDRRILTSIPGIGPRIAQVLLTEMPELGRCDRKAIASLAGLAPHISQSGKAPPRAAIAGGRPCIRAALYMSALVAVRRDPKMKLAYHALRDSGKPAKVALVAIARRILITANAMIKAQTPYKPDLNHT
jgi:transposase